MATRRFSPILIWSLVVVASVLLIGGSFGYAARVGDPTVREDAQRRSQRPPTRPATSLPGRLGVGGVGGVGSPSYDPGGGTGAGSGTFSFLSTDFSRVMPPVSCLNVLEDLVQQGRVTLEEVADAWNFVATCAASQGQGGIPPLEVLASDPLSQQCLAVALSRTALAYRAPSVNATPLDGLLADCQTRGAVPSLPGLTSGLTPPTSPRSGATVPGAISNPRATPPPAPAATTPATGADATTPTTAATTAPVPSS